MIEGTKWTIFISGMASTAC